MNVDFNAHRFFNSIVHLRWMSFSNFGLNEAFYNYYYAENRLYIIRDGLTDQLFFVQADSPRDAFLKFHRRMEDALNAGQYVREGEYDD